MTSLFTEMAQAVAAEKGERAEGRLNCRSAYYTPKPRHPGRKTRAQSPAGRIDSETQKRSSEELLRVQRERDKIRLQGATEDLGRAHRNGE
jgi:hypothetical protein